MDAELKQAPVAAIGTMDDRDPPIAPGDGAQIDHPQIGQTGRQQQARQSHWIAKMTFVDVEATTLLVRKEAFDLRSLAIPRHGHLSIVQITDQIQRRLAAPFPYRHRQYWPIARLRHLPICHQHDLIGLDAQGAERNVRIAAPDQNGASRATDVVPAVARKRRLQICPVKFTIAQEDDRRVRYTLSIQGRVRPYVPMRSIDD
jgi:hypothetical protein